MNKIIEFKQTKNNLTLKFETTPCRRTIFYDKTKYFLSFPTMCFNAIIDKYLIPELDINKKEYKKEYYSICVKIAFKISKTNYLIPLPNFNRDDTCLGVDSTDTTKTLINIFNNSDKEKLINFVCDKFWSTRFSDHLQENIKCYYDKDKKLANLDYWQQQTKQNPKWIPSPEDLILVS